MYKPNYKSKCCGAEVKVSSGVKDFENQRSLEGQTLHYECLKCGEMCDILDDNKVNA